MIEVKITKTETWPEPKFFPEEKLDKEHVLITSPGGSGIIKFFGNWTKGSNHRLLPKEIKDFSDKLWREKKTIHSTEIRIFNGLNVTKKNPPNYPMHLYFQVQ